MSTKTTCIMEKETDFARHLTIFLSDYLMKERGVSHHTLRSYAYTFDLMLDYMLEVKKIPAERQDSWTGYRLKENAPTTRVTHALPRYMRSANIYNTRTLRESVAGNK